MLIEHSDELGFLQVGGKPGAMQVQYADEVGDGKRVRIKVILEIDSRLDDVRRRDWRHLDGETCRC